MRRALVVSIALAGCGQPAPPTVDAPLACTAAAQSAPAATGNLFRATAPPRQMGPLTVDSARLPGRYLPVVPAPGSPVDAQGPVVIYLNRDGAFLRGDYDDASQNKSSVVAGAGKQLINYPAATFDDNTWNNIVACVADEFSRFDVSITDVRPAGSGYFMAMFGGNGSDVSSNGYGGIAPIDPQGCTIIAGAVVFIFSEVYGGVVNANCETAAQEISHAFSLDHEFLDDDPMTYLSYNGHKTFQDQDAMCGEFMARPCICGRPSQNSVAVLTDKIGLLGKPADHDPPVVAIASPSDGATVTEGALVAVVHADDNGVIAKLTLTMQDASGTVTSECGDGKIPCTIDQGDYSFQVPGGKGYANLYAVGVDGANNSTTSNLVHLKFVPAPTSGTITVTVDPASATVSATRSATVKAKITTTLGTIDGANLIWSDGSGAPATWPMCPAGGGIWQLTMQLGSDGAARTFSVAAHDTVGDQATSPSLMAAP